MCRQLSTTCMSEKQAALASERHPYEQVPTVEVAPARLRVCGKFGMGASAARSTPASLHGIDICICICIGVENALEKGLQGGVWRV